AVVNAAEEGKFYSADNFTTNAVFSSIPFIFIGNVLNSLHQYTSSQDVVQRYQTTPTIQATKKSLIVNGILALITIPLF
ncbi:Na+/proline symporter, partial [Lactobacillus gasseri]|nr:Na+/proline symporter [Lactobacillus gasseri]